MKVYLLCEIDEYTHGAWSVLGWSFDRPALEVEMNRREAEHHEQEIRDSAGKPWRVLPLDQTSHRHYFIEEVEQLTFDGLDKQA